MNPAGYCVIITTIICFIIGGALLGTGMTNANKCTNIAQRWVPCTSGSFSSQCDSTQYTDCVVSAARLVLAGIIMLIVGGIMACVSCCACAGVDCFRSDSMPATSVVYSGQQPAQGYPVQAAYAPPQPRGGYNQQQNPYANQM